MTGNETTRPPVERSLRLRLRIFTAVFVVALVIVVVEVVALGSVAVLPVLVAFGIGLLVGVLASRMLALRWDATSRTVVGRIDAVGAVVLVCYLVLVVFRSRLVELWTAAPVAGVAGVAALAGLMSGQLVGTVGGIARVAYLAGLAPGSRRGHGSS